MLEVAECCNAPMKRGAAENHVRITNGATPKGRAAVSSPRRLAGRARWRRTGVGILAVRQVPAAREARAFDATIARVDRSRVERPGNDKECDQLSHARDPEDGSHPTSRPLGTLIYPFT